ncbi:MAG TPA: thiamine phosphate synthase [Acidobacteriaceae bacterium]|nr:thiamine phosphate synthase [Acidobacteriaceae bacterium]
MSADPIAAQVCRDGNPPKLVSMLRYAITDRRLLGRSDSARAEGLVAQAERLAARGDVDFLQLREKDLLPAQLAALARRILEVLRTRSPGAPSVRGLGAPFIRDRQGAGEWEVNRSHRPRLLINSRVDVAITVNADGVHLTSSPGELTPEQVRALYVSAGLPLPTVSLSCHTLADVIAARGLRSEEELCFAPDPATTPDLILFGPVFEKRVDDQLVTEGSGLKLLRQACAAASPIPVLALGGITEENAAVCLEAGAAGIAGIRLYSLIE